MRKHRKTRRSDKRRNRRTRKGGAPGNIFVNYSMNNENEVNSLPNIKEDIRVLLQEEKHNPSNSISKRIEELKRRKDETERIIRELETRKELYKELKESGYYGEQRMLSMIEKKLAKLQNPKNFSIIHTRKRT